MKDEMLEGGYPELHGHFWKIPGYPEGLPGRKIYLEKSLTYLVFVFQYDRPHQPSLLYFGRSQQQNTM